jgi:serine/threonine protein kinase
MEYVPHGDLFSFLRQQQGMGWQMRLKIALNIAEGMEFLHQMSPPILHRDLKTPNVLMASLDPSAPVVAKLTDFGETRELLCKLKGREGLTNPAWLAPEVMASEAYTEKVDVFPFGIILWELYFRQYPYSEHQIASTRFAYRLEDAILSGLRPTFSPTFENFPENTGRWKRRQNTSLLLSYEPHIIRSSSLHPLFEQAPHFFFFHLSFFHSRSKETSSVSRRLLLSCSTLLGFTTRFSSIFPRNRFEFTGNHSRETIDNQS